ncbi:hypothetical protein HDU67_006270 [Dinochytrium kinnereticum]|nr:hypothetical protein HDU67_006270 [Dinochytrium kinnereticum]
MATVTDPQRVSVDNVSTDASPHSSLPKSSSAFNPPPVNRVAEEKTLAAADFYVSSLPGLEDDVVGKLSMHAG